MHDLGLEAELELKPAVVEAEGRAVQHETYCIRRWGENCIRALSRIEKSCAENYYSKTLKMY